MGTFGRLAQAAEAAWGGGTASSVGLPGAPPFPSPEASPLLLLPRCHVPKCLLASCGQTQKTRRSLGQLGNQNVA
ncbi:hypothetical protein L345_16322 [Ophiophagus hannah]|uniref:Uncharacterized protein n=1 Tax=Ophiophagus hannah TaxID=8665 RepID=V8N8R2_OPHHA|nr:hypothetical protein L345_16322 [Ophiophagus hannah]